MMMEQRDWKEFWVDEMGLIVALDGNKRFELMADFKLRMVFELSPNEQSELKDCLRKRFTPSNGDNGCQSATQAVREAIA